MKYELNTVCNRPLKYLIEEGFINMKVVVSPETKKRNIVLDVRAVPNLPIKKEEVENLIMDTEFIRRHSKENDGENTHD